MFDAIKRLSLPTRQTLRFKNPQGSTKGGHSRETPIQFALTHVMLGQLAELRAIRSNAFVPLTMAC